MSDSLPLAEAPKELRHASEIVAAYVSRNKLSVEEVLGMIRSVYGTIAGLGSSAPSDLNEPLKPAVPVKKSVMPDYIICLEDGKKLKTLKRYLRTRYELSPHAYRQRWGLPAEYPMTAPNYGKIRSALAKKSGLGRGAKKSTARKRLQKQA